MGGHARRACKGGLRWQANPFAAPLRASNVNVFSRRIKSNIVSGLALLATVIVIAPLIAILFYLLNQGIGSLNWDFFTKIPEPAGESGGGMANAIVGSG